MKRKTLLLLPLLLLPMVSCASQDGIDTLIIYNWQDYIFLGDEEMDGIVEQFQDYYFEKYSKNIDVQYYTFETNENMLNILRTGKSHYDLVCPSDYAIQKMIKEGMCEKIPTDYDHIPNYTKYASPYIKQLFEEAKVTINGTSETVSWSEYAIPYFWGTIGFMYNPETIDSISDNVTSWSMLLDEEYKGQFTLKDSVRDTYVAGILGSYADTKYHFFDGNYYSLNDLAALYEDIEDEVTLKQYQKYLNEIINATSDEDLEKAVSFLKAAKENAYGFEVDSGKADIVTGKIGMNFCWSGDAVYAMDCAEEDSDVYLNYSIPSEGSNVWFDGWVMPKGANVNLACEFLNFIQDPEKAALNMNEVGYTSSVAGDDILLLAIDWYGSRDVYEYDEDDCLIIDEQTNSYNMLLDQDSINDMLENETLYAYDLTYFFGSTVQDIYKKDDKVIVYSSEKGRQFSAQFPSLKDLSRCGIMEDFGNRNPYVLQAWSIIKASSIEIWEYIFVGLLLLIFLTTTIVSYQTKRVRKQRIKDKNK